MLPINLNSPGYTGRKGRYKMAQKTGGGGDKPSKYLGSGYQGYGQNQYQNYPNYMQQPYYSYGGGGRYYNPFYIGLINWRI